MNMFRALWSRWFCWVNVLWLDKHFRQNVKFGKPTVKTSY